MLKLAYKVESRGGAMVSTSALNAGDPWFESRTWYGRFLYVNILLFILYIYIYIYVRRKERIGTIPELSLCKVGILPCPPIPELYRTILELRKGYISGCYRVLFVRKVGIGLGKVGI